jgi:hypothetical protein
VGLWVVDGNNVYGSRPDGWWRDRPAAATRLAVALDRWQAADGTPVVLVLDGQPVDAVAGLARPGLEVRFAPGGRDAADDAIVELVGQRYADEPDLTVVTADRGLIARLPPGVTVESPRRLLAMLDG